MKEHKKHRLFEHFNLPRVHALVHDAISEFELDMKGLNVLTEAASDYYMLTPIIAALAGAEHVYALTKDSCYGKASEITEATMSLASLWGVNDRIQVIRSRTSPEIRECDVVTNLGHVRPLDEDFLKGLKETVAISLMCETWEVRREDVDLLTCGKLGIPVLGTNEEHSSLEVFRYVGYLAAKLLFELDIEVYRSRVAVLGGGKFGREAVKALETMGADVVHLQTENLCVLSSQKAREAIRGCDAIVIAEHVNRQQLIGPDGPIEAKILSMLSPGIVLAHIAGNVDEADIKKNNIPFRPEGFARAGYMSVTTAHLGPRPLIDLHAAGLRVGEVMVRARLAGRDRAGAEQAALQHGIADVVD